MDKLYTLFLFIFSIFATTISAQNEFYIQNGALVFINGQDGSVGQYNPSDKPTLYIQGSLTNLNDDVVGEGLQNNSGEIQITGNWTNTTGGFSTSGDEVFIGNTTQRLSGGFVGTNSALNNLIINKTGGAIVELNANVHVSNTLRFGTNGRIRTDIASYGNDGSAYSNVLTVTSSNPSSIVGYNTSGTDKYVEGKLARAVNGANTYFFPVGVAPASWDGLEPFQIGFSSATASTITGFVYPRNISLIGKNVFNDVNSDGIYDLITIDCELPLQWSINTSGGTYNYDISFFPGPSVETCEWDNTYGTPLSFTARNSLIGDVLEVPAPFPFASQGTGFITSPTGYSLAGLSAFSEFTLPGKSDLTPPVLPVELILFTGYPVDNKYIELKWITASEINNDGFEIQRSTDGVTFTAIGYADGKGTTSETSSYTFQDFNVTQNVVYFYRLKQVDFDGSTSFSNIVRVRLLPGVGGGWTISNFIPNPAVSSSYLNLQTSSDINLDYVFYDVLGRVIERKTSFFSKGNHLIEMDVEALAGGIYFISVTDGKLFYDRKLIKVADN